MSDGRHIRSHMVKLSAAWADYGHKTLCNKKVKYADTTPRRSYGQYCPKCIRSLMMKKEMEIERLKGFLHDT